MHFSAYILILLLSIAAIYLAEAKPWSTAQDPDEDDDWKACKQSRGNGNAYGRSKQEDKTRWGQFKKTNQLIQDHNKKFQNKQVNFQVAMNDFCDMLPEEIAMRRGFRRVADNTSTTVKSRRRRMVTSMNLSVAIDWRNKGAVTPVKDQGNCGSCWTFASTGAMEGRYYLKYGKLMTFSQQHLLDCSGRYGNAGCNGGNQAAAFNYVLSNKGINDAASYPYKAVESGYCKASTTKYSPLTGSYGYTRLNYDENKILEALKTGPVSISIDASLYSFSYYKSGIYNPSGCSTNLNHAMLLVGYDVDRTTPSNPRPYWIVKNSWGTSWGENGYVKIAAGVNMCGFATDATYPLIY